MIESRFYGFHTQRGVKANQIALLTAPSQGLPFLYGECKGDASGGSVSNSKGREKGGKRRRKKGLKPSKW